MPTNSVSEFIPTATGGLFFHLKDRQPPSPELFEKDKPAIRGSNPRTQPAGNFQRLGQHGHASGTSRVQTQGASGPTRIARRRNATSRTNHATAELTPSAGFHKLPEEFLKCRRHVDQSFRMELHRAKESRVRFLHCLDSPIGRAGDDLEAFRNTIDGLVVTGVDRVAGVQCPFQLPVPNPFDFVRQGVGLGMCDGRRYVAGAFRRTPRSLPECPGKCQAPAGRASTLAGKERSPFHRARRRRPTRVFRSVQPQAPTITRWVHVPAANQQQSVTMLEEEIE